MANNSFIDKILECQLRDYFVQHPDQYDELRSIIRSKSVKKADKPHVLPSLRGLEFVTTYLARHNEGIGFYNRNDDGTISYVDIHNAYKTALGDYKKKRFDSFRRSPPFEFTIPSREGAPIVTTIGQLQWGRWIYERKIMDWVKVNWPNVRKEMAKNLKIQRATKCSPRASRKRKRTYQQRVRSGQIIIKW